MQAAGHGKVGKSELETSLRTSEWGGWLAGAALCLGLVACEGAPSEPKAESTEQVAASGTSETRVERVPGLRFEIPDAWSSEAPQSSMRLAQFRVADDAELVLFRFPGGGGSADANVARWVSQYTQPDGSPSRDRAVVQRAESGDGLTLTRLDIRGTYAGQKMPGAPPQPAIDDARLLALVVEGSGAPYFFKLQGSAESVGPWVEEWDAMAASISQDFPVP